MSPFGPKTQILTGVQMFERHTNSTPLRPLRSAVLGPIIAGSPPLPICGSKIVDVGCYPHINLSLICAEYNYLP